MNGQKRRYECTRTLVSARSLFYYATPQRGLMYFLHKLPAR